MMRHNALPRAVSFSLPTSELFEPFVTYAVAISSLISHRMEQLDLLVGARARTMHPISAAIREVYANSSQRARVRVLLAPESTFRLRLAQPLEDGLAFVQDSLWFESMLENGAPAKEHWSALGDVWVNPAGEVVRQPSVPGLPPLDFQSPVALTVDMSGRDD